MTTPRLSDRYESLDEYLELIFSMLDGLEAPDEIRAKIEEYVPEANDPETRDRFKVFLRNLFEAKFGDPIDLD